MIVLQKVFLTFAIRTISVAYRKEVKKRNWNFPDSTK